MNCPVDTPLPVIAGLQGIEIDLCPVCRGVWLDRGELDKLIDRAVGLEAAVRAQGGRRHHDDDDDEGRPYREGASPSKPTSSGTVVLAVDGAVRNAGGTPRVVAGPTLAEPHNKRERRRAADESSPRRELR